MIRRLPLVLGLALLLAASCTRRGAGPSPIDFSYHVQAGLEELHSLALVAHYHAAAVDPSATVIDTAMASSLRELGRFEVRTLTVEERDAHFTEPARMLRNLTPDTLRTFRERYGVDGIVVGRIDHYDSFDPMAVGLEVHLVSCRDGATLWSAIAHFDGRRADVQRDIRNWHAATLGDGRPTIGGWQMTLQSPGLFCRYVADRLTASMQTP